MEPEKPFACSFLGCGMMFTNEDHLHVHTKKHDMVLQLGIEQKAAFVDQTPTPTRFMRNCEEVGLFQDLQNVNPFDDGFKRAMELKHSAQAMELAVPSADDCLHTPHMVYPLNDLGESTLFSTTNNHRNITISRSSSDESGAVKEYETTTISKLTNEVTTISRIVGKQDVLDRVTTTDDVSIVRQEETARNRDGVNETSVSYTNNVIKFHTNVEIRKDGNVFDIETSKAAPTPVLKAYTDSVIKDTSVIKDDLKRLRVPPIMSQKSLDFVVDSLTSDCNADLDKDGKMPKQVATSVINSNIKSEVGSKIFANEKQSNPDHVTKGLEDYEVIIKLPNGRQVRMKGVDEETAERTIQTDTKEKLKKSIRNKAKRAYQSVPSIPNSQIVNSVLPISTGTLIPVTIVNPSLLAVPKLPIVPLSKVKSISNFKKVKRKQDTSVDKMNQSDSIDSTVKSDRVGGVGGGDDDRHVGECIVIDDDGGDEKIKKDSVKAGLESRSAASKRYRERLKESMHRQKEENHLLREQNQRLSAEKAALKLIITEHLKKCPNGDELRCVEERLSTVIGLYLK